MYAFLIIFFVVSQNFSVFAKDGKEGKSFNSDNNTDIPKQNDQFQWNQHNKLSWDDFRGTSKDAAEESAAATHCGIGFRLNTNKQGDKTEIIVYNTFYANKSWVKPDGKISSVLDHEQGHFDLCEIYTRKLRDRMNNVYTQVPDIMKTLMSVYSEISNEYESRQQAYEQETTHGTNISEQRKWKDMMAKELSGTNS